LGDALRHGAYSVGSKQSCEPVYRRPCGTRRRDPSGLAQQRLAVRCRGASLDAADDAAIGQLRMGAKTEALQAVLVPQHRQGWVDIGYGVLARQSGRPGRKPAAGSVVRLPAINSKLARRRKPHFAGHRPEMSCKPVVSGGAHWFATLPRRSTWNLWQLNGGGEVPKTLNGNRPRVPDPEQMCPPTLHKPCPHKLVAPGLSLVATLARRGLWAERRSSAARGFRRGVGSWLVGRPRPGWGLS